MGTKWRRGGGGGGEGVGERGSDIKSYTVPHWCVVQSIIDVHDNKSLLILIFIYYIRSLPLFFFFVTMNITHLANGLLRKQYFTIITVI